MRTFIDPSTGSVRFLLSGETPDPSWVEIIDQYKKYTDPQGNIHSILRDAIPNNDWTEYIENPFAVPDPNYVPPYDALRMNAYPQIANQLDMLWHELNTSGSISTNGTWFNEIKNIKDQFPKS